MSAIPVIEYLSGIFIFGFFKLLFNDIIDAINEGTSIILHRDHGSFQGWGTPSFKSRDLDRIVITDNQYPIAYSINCASGFFDNESERGLYWTMSSSISWAEHFIRNEHGAIGIICSARASGTKLNNLLAKLEIFFTLPCIINSDE